MKELIFAAPFRGVDPVDSESFKGIIRRSAGVVEPARLESVYARKGIKGSNPFSSAGLCSSRQGAVLIFTRGELVQLSGKIRTANERSE